VSARADVLVVRDAALGMRAPGVAMLAAGAVMLPSGGAVPGAVLAAGGFLLAVGPRVHTAVFDRAAGTLRLRSRGVFGHDDAAVPLDEVASVHVDGTLDSDGEAVHLLVVRFRDGSTRPLPPSLASRARLHRAAVEIRGFLGLRAAPGRD
jgi:hypothetical protein